MPRIDIHTTLGFCPKPKKHEIIVITRGATASINFSLFDKVYSIDNIDQLTYSFKQGKNLYYYNMVEYYKLTSDIVARTDMIYYTKYEPNLPAYPAGKFVATPVPVGGSVVGLYERTDLMPGEESQNWQFDSHFMYHAIAGYEYVSFTLNSEETKQFKITTPDNNMECEVAIRLNTDASRFELAGLDSIIINPQHPIAVIDSLYSKIE